MSASIHETIAFMKALRRGVTADEFLQPTLEKQERQIDEKINRTAVALIEKNQTIQNMIRSRLEQASISNILKQKKEQIEEYNTQIKKLQLICNDLQNTSDERTKALHAKEQSVEILIKELESLRMLLRKVSSRYEKPLLELGSGACEAISSLVKSQQKE